MRLFVAYPIIQPNTNTTMYVFVACIMFNVVSFKTNLTTPWLKSRYVAKCLKCLKLEDLMI